MFHVKQFAKLEQFCIQNHIIYNEETRKKFVDFYDLLVERNKIMNLTAITEPEEVELKHFIDSLASVNVIRELNAEREKTSVNFPFRVVDIGTGAGFPGMPLAIVLPEMDFTLADALNKRIGFLYETAEMLKLANVTTVHARAEDLGSGNLRETFDCCVSRAVADMAVLAEYCLPMIKKGGSAILYKSSGIEDEIENARYAINELGGEIESIQQFALFGTDISRTLVIIKKKKETPGKYPRKAGKPAKSPLQKNHR